MVTIKVELEVMHALANGAIGFDLDPRVTLRGQIEVKHISADCNLETLVDRTLVTIKTYYNSCSTCSIG